MNNADKFKQIFDLYATELWAMSEKDLLAWLNSESDVPDTNVGDSISRRAAIKAVHDEFDECLVWDESGECTANEVEKVLDELPTINAVPVVRCKDCKWWREETDHTCRKWGGASPRNANGYCDSAERSEDGET